MANRTKPLTNKGFYDKMIGEVMKMKHVDIYTDGACRGNPGKGGWGAVLVYRGVEKELSGGEPMTTNNRM